MIVTVTTQQAAYLASLLQTAQRAQTAFGEALALVTLGHVGPEATLQHIDTDAGTLTFAVPPVTVVSDGD